ncbi:hypothetical protein NDU88_003546 [Pleurodeles waltl]|uniref:Uncharacterized protein n=1 Tax=Pleurodeles waltl TaxID=8319 RepID=A0AAV7UYR9_PLEWA|nr:hypothetical protein NDU88_003546 [Pleurodeles waltl]
MKRNRGFLKELPLKKDVTAVSRTRSTKRVRRLWISPQRAADITARAEGNQLAVTAASDTRCYKGNNLQLQADSGTETNSKGI